MKKNLLIIGTLTVVAVFTSAFIIKQHTGMAGKTGSGGEVTCASCHTPGAAVATVSITGSPAFTGNQYVPGLSVGTASLVFSAGPVGLVNIESNIVSLTVFPNPSEDNISLQYSLINDGSVKASLYNLQGKEICILFNGNQTAGLHTKTIIYPNDVASGVYLVKLSSNGKDLVEKMIIKK